MDSEFTQNIGEMRRSVNKKRIRTLFFVLAKSIAGYH